MNPKEFKKEDLKEKEKLGSGSFGDVFLAEYHGKNYAIKKIPKSKIHDNADEDLNIYMKNALDKEIYFLKIMSKFENSAKYYYDFEDDNNYIIILEYCETNLEDLLHEKKKFCSSEILEIMEKLNKPFKYMFENGLIHRDIKPANILIKYIDDSKTKFIPKITDYGIARYLEGGVACSNVGSGAYKAPEVVFDDEYTNKSDLYSIGVMMYKLYFNEFPFKISQKKKMKNCEDKNLDDLINKLLILEPSKRISWKEYFGHPFFKSNKKIEELNNKLDKLKINDEEHKIIQLYDFIIDKMLFQNNIETIKLEANIIPQNFISIKDCLNSNNDSFFILGILGTYLEQIGIRVLIEKDNIKRDDNLREYHKNIFQFICNSYILKQKYLLDFDLGENRKKRILTNPIERANFNETLKNIIIKKYNLQEEELLITNHRRKKSNKFSCIIIFKSNFNKKIRKEELIEVLDGEFKTLSNVDIEKIIPSIKLSIAMLSPKNNNKGGKWVVGDKRGGEDYIPPIGWENFAININHCFEDKNKEWLGHLHKPGEWCVAYCPLKGLTKSMEQIYENDDDIRHPGKKVGTGVYCYADPKLLEENTETINANGKNYKVAFMLRVRPDKFRASAKNNKVYIVNGNDNEFRPYGIITKVI